jgi:hypothetical protein
MKFKSTYTTNYSLIPALDKYRESKKKKTTITTTTT